MSQQPEYRDEELCEVEDWDAGYISLQEFKQTADELYDKYCHTPCVFILLDAGYNNISVSVVQRLEVKPKLRKGSAKDQLVELCRELDVKLDEVRDVPVAVAATLDEIRNTLKNIKG